MIKHLVWWTLKPQAEGNSARENALKLQGMLNALKDLDCVQSLETVVDVMPSSTEDVHLLLCSTHATLAQLKEYAAHPDHIEVADFMRKVVANRKAIDYDI
ncbi:MAG: Dabb family protein [Desulfovibrionaceae bacterium]